MYYFAGTQHPRFPYLPPKWHPGILPVLSCMSRSIVTYCLVFALPYAVALRPRGRRHSVEQRSRPAVAFLSGYTAWVCLATCYPLSESNKTLRRVRTKVTWHCRSVLHPYISDPQTSNPIRIVAENQAEPRGWEEKAGRQRSTHWKEKCEFGAFESGGNTQNVLKFPSRKMAKAFHTITNGFETIGIEICIGGPASSGEPKHRKHMLVTNLPNRLMFLFFWSWPLAILPSFLITWPLAILDILQKITLLTTTWAYIICSCPH